MSNVVSMERSCDYLVRRAAASRRKGNYDAAMTLLAKAKDQFGLSEEIELEMARVYEEIECEEEAARAYLRVVRLGGKHAAHALFQLALSAMQRADFSRAVSYFDLFMASDRSGVSAEYAELLGDQLAKEMNRPLPKTRMGRAMQLRRRAIACIHEGKTTSARRALSHALHLCEKPQLLTLLACCSLMDGDASSAIEHASRAHAASRRSIQPLLVLADAYSLLGDDSKALTALYKACMLVRNAEDAMACAIESAKRGQDQLTLLLTRKALKTEPKNTRLMMMRACALTNMGRLADAARLFGRVCVLMPENTVSEMLYHAVRAGEKPEEPLTLGLDVSYQEGVARASQMVAAIYMSKEDLESDHDRERMLCRYAAWALRSQLARGQVTTVAILLMTLMGTPLSIQVLDDALMDPAVEDELKSRILQLRMQDGRILDFPVDLGGRLVHLAAGGSAQTGCDSELCRRIVQRAADSLLPAFCDAPQVILGVWLQYLSRHGTPPRRHAAACACALEAVYHERAGHPVDLKKIAQKHSAMPRLCRRLFMRMLAADSMNNQ